MEIIVIEDDEEKAESIVGFLRREFEVQVTLIQDGLEAAKYSLLNLDNTPRLILLDLILPGLDGLDLFRIIRSEPPSRNISVMFLVNGEQSKSYVQSLGLQPDGYMKKCRGPLPLSRI